MRHRAHATGRGCGEARIQGGVYVEAALGIGGLPIESFIFDPPKPWPDIHASVGVDLIEFDGVFHIFDVVGSDDYPSPADILEEIMAKGASRKVSPMLDFSKLTTRSRLILLHRKAIIKNLDQVAPWEKLNPNFAQLDGLKCAHYVKNGQPTQPHDHGREHIENHTIPCVAYHWMLFPPGDPETKDSTVGDLTYPVWYPAGGYGVDPVFSVGIIANLPITGISVISATDGSHRATLQHIKGSTNIWTREEEQ